MGTLLSNTRSYYIPSTMGVFSQRDPKDLKRQTLKEIVMALNISAILADGHIDESETISIQDAICFGNVTEEDLRTLFMLKDEADSYCSAFGDLVVLAAVDFALNDPITPGVVDADEAAVLNELMLSDNVLDEVEDRILTTIRKQATQIHPSLLS
jgi:hypothetical protein